jgi:ribose transport system substrate-binding protein
MKKWMRGPGVVIAAVAAFGLLLTGCSSNSGGTAGSNGKYVIGYDSYFVGNTWSAQLEAEFKSAAKRENAKLSDVIITQSNNDAQKQISNIQSMRSRGTSTPLSSHRSRLTASPPC